MKNKFLFLVTFLGVALFSACNDDDDDKTKDLNGTYSGTSTEHVLDLKYSDAALAGKTVEFSSEDNETATLKLKGVVPGEQETVFSGVALEGDGAVYSFTVENKNDARVVTLKGTVQEGKLSLEVNVKFAQNELIGTWDLSGALTTWKASLNGENKNDYKLGTLKNGNYESDITTGLISSVGPSVLLKVLKNYLQNVTFLEDGNIVATYNAAEATEEAPEPIADWKKSAINLAHYCVKDGVCYVYLNVAMIMDQVSKDNVGRANAPDPMYSILEQLLNNGIPVHYNFKQGEEGVKSKLEVYVDEVLAKQLKPLIPLLGGLVEDGMEIEVNYPPLFNGSIPVNPILENLPGALDATREMKIGLKLVEAE